MSSRLRNWQTGWVVGFTAVLLAFVDFPARAQSVADLAPDQCELAPLPINPLHCPPPSLYPLAPAPGTARPPWQPAPSTPEQPPSTTPEQAPSTTPEQAPATPPTAPQTDMNLDTARSAAGRGESFALAAPTIYGDFSGVNIPGAIIANVPGRGTVLLTAGANPNQVFPAGTTFSFPTLTPAGTVRPAGVPLTSPQPLGQVPTGLLNSSLAAAAGVSPIVARGSFKIAENESARPQDRVFGTYNFFYDINGSLVPEGLGFPITSAHREDIGFEKTFLDGDASIEMRLPFFQIHGIVGASDVGDLSVILKYAFINDRETGNVFSGGIVVTVPTGQDVVPFLAPDIHSTILQPYVGAIYNFSDRFYYQGFLSLAVPTESRDVTLLFNDLSFGYTLYRCTDQEALVSSVTPTFEIHVTTPLNHRGALAQPIGVADIVDVTTGVTVGLGKRSTFGIAICTPLTGPKPFDLETLVQVNYKF